MENVEIAKVFEQIADLLEIKGDNPFRIRAYRTAARTVETTGASCATLAKRDPKALEKLPGIAKDLAGKICEIVETGDLALRRELATQLPESLVEMIRLPGLGPKRAKLIYDSLHIKTLDELEAAARAGRLHELRGLGPVVERQILQAIADRSVGRAHPAGRSGRVRAAARRRSEEGRRRAGDRGSRQLSPPL